MISSYYKYDKALSYNAVYNFIVGGRGTGKTYGGKRHVTRKAVKTHDFGRAVDAVKNGDMFIYLRRYKTELRMARDTFFADFQHEFPEWDFRVNGYEAQMSPVSERDVKKRRWDTIGYFIALVVAQSYKSVAFPRVKTIIFDEFIIEKGAIHYLPDEAKVFNNFYSTVDRYKDKTQVFFLANSVSITNPYFIEYGIEPKKCDANGFIRIGDGFMLAHFLDSKEFESEVYQTRFGRFIENSEYADYAVGNQFSDNHDMLISGKTSKATYLMSLETDAMTFSIWFDMKNGGYYCQAKRPKDEIMFTLLPERMGAKKTLMLSGDKNLARLKLAFKHDLMRFDKPPTRQAFLELFKR